MAIDSIQVGSNTRQVVAIGDPAIASQYSSVLGVSDGVSTSGKFAQLINGIKLLLNPAGTFDRARSSPGAIGVQAVSAEGTKNTYSVASNSISLAATATDFWELIGSGTKTVRVLKIAVTGLATAAATREILLIVRSTADSGGTATQPTIVPNDSNNAAASAVVNLYSANPTLGSAVGTIRARNLNLGAAGAAGVIEWKFSDVNDQALVLRGVAQVLCLNFAGAAVPSGTSITVECTFVEDNS